MTAGTGGIAAGSLTVTLTGLNPPNSGTAGDTVNLVSEISSATGGNAIEAAYTTDSGTCTLAAAGSVGSTTVNDAHAYPNSAGALADFSIDFTVDKFMPAGSSVDIKLDTGIGTLFSGASGSQADDCWATE